MTLKEAVGVKSVDIDARTGAQLSHEEIYGRIIEFLGGLDEVGRFIPFQMSEIRDALENGDEHLNTLPLKEWDRASGFIADHRGNCVFTGGGIWTLYVKYGITAASSSDGVCILKEAARRIAQEERRDVKSIDGGRQWANLM